MDRLADAIVSAAAAEYYMETLQAWAVAIPTQPRGPQACVQALEQQQTLSNNSAGRWTCPALQKTVQISTVCGTIIDVGDPVRATMVGIPLLPS